MGVITAVGNGSGEHVVRPLRDFRVWLRGDGGLYWPGAGMYREEIRQRLGVLPESDAFRRLQSEEARELRRKRSALFERDDLLGAEEPPEVAARLLSTLATAGALEGRDLGMWERRLDDAADRARRVRLAMATEIES